MKTTGWFFSLLLGAILLMSISLLMATPDPNTKLNLESYAKMATIHETTSELRTKGYEISQLVDGRWESGGKRSITPLYSSDEYHRLFDLCVENGGNLWFATTTERPFIWSYLFVHFHNYFLCAKDGVFMWGEDSSSFWHGSVL
ncbi:hypothetical protein [uncultured Pelagimonas sp.]|uniref:hypothetical protein n=1 Tax=uncultured Pelagimonas sp. TaxID=1618102 RepID=UPI002617D6FF|nr:hypothetical protein [uncultured Pelagimonas sp.]